MKEYTLIIKGEMDFIILSPQVLSSLITQIHNSPERKVVVSIESIMPPKFTDYLLRVINSNRFSNERFRYCRQAAQYLLPLGRSEKAEAASKGRGKPATDFK